MSKQEERQLEDDVERALREVLDPELGLDVVELGLVYRIAARADAVEIDLTMTSPACPLGEEIVRDAKRAALAVAGVREAVVQLVWVPAWGPERMSAAARRTLGWR